MKRLGDTTIICLGVLLLALGALAGTLQGQTATSSAPAATVQGPSGLNHSVEQIERDARTFEQELRTQIADLQERLAKEVEMSSPGLSKLKDLSAQLQDKSKEWESRAKEMGARAEEYAAEIEQEVGEKADQMVREMPRVFVEPFEEASGWLGIEIGEVTQEQARDLRLTSARGVLVMDVEPDSPAAKAGLKENDVIAQFDGETVAGTAAFRRMVRETPPGRTVTLAVTRDGATQNISVELGDRGAFYEKKMKGRMREFGGMNVPVMPSFDMHDFPEVRDLRTPVLGINAEDLTGQLGAFFGAPDNAGVLVREVRSGSVAEKAGLKAGDVIVKVGDAPVRSLAELREQLRGKSDQKTVSLGILRKGSEMSVTVGIELPHVGPMQKVYRRAES